MSQIHSWFPALQCCQAYAPWMVSEAKVVIVAAVWQQGGLHDDMLGHLAYQGEIPSVSIPSNLQVSAAHKQRAGFRDILSEPMDITTLEG